ncbi:OmpA family protein [Actinoallomurus soli]|uniref:OmpA family protein n=1 Tax=Actinoallomurus soli TaxID=2952535 RepID=UPI002093F697|nr:OmpA family protein [Actinoallomurus soli]MCO5973869.1 OmpA family protein [Actinoallomurus soli]
MITTNGAAMGGLNRGLGTVVTAVAVVVGVAGCNDETGGDASASPTAKPSAHGVVRVDGAPLRTHYMSWPGKSFTVDLMGLDQVAPARVVARFRVTAGPGSAVAPTAWAAPAHPGDHAPSGALLLDPAHATEYPVLRTQAGACLCTELTDVKAGQQVDVDAAFPAPPGGAGKMIVVFPNTPPFLGVPIAAHAPYVLHQRPGGTPLNPVTTPAAGPESYPLVTTVRHGDETDATGGGKTSVRLSSDVLFATNSAALTAKARTLLKQVSAKIEKSPGDTVAVDGYADNTGTDAVNLPLSKKRAENVRATLRQLVKRQGMRYSAAGHGSADPIADNTKPAGRALNRRVVITFAALAQPPQDKRPLPTANADPAGRPEPPALVSVHAGKRPIPLLPWPKSMTFGVTGLIREPSGFAVLTWTLHNVNRHPIPAGFATDLADVFRNAGPGRIVLGVGQDEYKNVTDTRQQAVFPGYSLHQGDVVVRAQGSLVGWNMFRLPAGVRTVTVRVPGFPAVTNVPVQAPKP